MHQSQNRLLKRHIGKVWMTRLYLPLLLATFSVGMLSGHFVSRRLIIICPVMLLAIFFLSLATIEVNGTVMRYPRFLRWTTIEEGAVLDSGALWPGVLGYIHLSHFVSPWNKLYFVLDERPGRNPFARGDSLLLTYLREKAGGTR
jgi:hypothetical protein